MLQFIWLTRTGGFCNESSHKYQQLPLIPVEEFLQQRQEFVDADEKSLMVARIHHELAEREALEQARQGLLKKKQGLIADNKKRKEDLASLDKDLETFIDVSRTWFLRFPYPAFGAVSLMEEIGCETHPEDL